MIKLTYYDAQVGRDITGITGNYSRSDNIDSLGAELTFDLIDNPLDTNFKNKALKLGGKVAFINNDEIVFTGVIVEANKSNLNKWTYKAYDYGYYLNKSEAMIQFNNVSVTDALKRLCAENQIAIGEITQINLVVNKIYNGDKISEIIKDLLKMATDETGQKFRLEVRDNKLFIDKYEDLIVTATYSPAEGTTIDATMVVGSFNTTESIEEMVNRVIVVASSEQNAQIYGNVEDSESIKTYGLLTKVEKVEDKNKSQAVQIASTKLKELNKVKKSFKVTLFGDDAVRAGRTLVFNQPEINLVGAYLVKNCTHTYNGKLHLMNLDLVVI